MPGLKSRPISDARAETEVPVYLRCAKAGRMKDNSTEYPHRLNAEGSYDSICRRCFRTVARAETEAELRAYEAKHICDPHMMTEHAYFDRV